MRLLFLAALFVATSACFNDHVPPPSFRFACEDDDECGSAESCIDDLCQRACTQRSANEDCPSSLGYAGCFNGVCANICDPDAEDICPSPQECLDLGVMVSEDIDNPFGGETMSEIGLCASDCNEDSCPADETCFMGVCLASCDDSEDCPEGQTCTMDLCVPGDDADATASASTPLRFGDLP